jgi:hypothetical protein
LHAKKKKGERDRGTPPTARSSGDQQWCGDRTSIGDGACAREERCRGVYEWGK